jgi:hypothetical protein
MTHATNGGITLLVMVVATLSFFTAYLLPSVLHPSPLILYGIIYLLMIENLSFRCEIANSCGIPGNQGKLPLPTVFKKKAFNKL